MGSLASEAQEEAAAAAALLASRHRRGSITCLDAFAHVLGVKVSRDVTLSQHRPLGF
jgi:hypothetical protein